jgi:hypothetical protein
MDIWKVCINILSLILDVLLFIAAIINMIPPAFVNVIEMLYVCVFTAALFIVELMPIEKLRELVRKYAGFWLTLLGRGLTYILIGCLTFRVYDSERPSSSAYVLSVSIIAIVLGFLFCIAQFFIRYLCISHYRK